MTSLYISKSPQEYGWQMLSIVGWGGVTCLFGDVLVNIPSLAIYLFHASQEWSRCGVLLKHDKAPWSTEVCIVCSPSLPVCLPAMQIVSPPWCQAKQKVVCDISSDPHHHRRRHHPIPPPSLSLSLFLYSHLSACLGCCLLCYYIADVLVCISWLQKMVKFNNHVYLLLGGST